MTYQTLWTANKPLRCLFLGMFASSIGDWCRHVAVVSLAISYSGAGLETAVLLFLEMIPLLIAGPVVGVLIDRKSPRKIMMVCDIFRAVLVLCFLFVQTKEQLWLAYILTALIAVFDATYLSAQQTLISRMASSDSMVTAHSLFSLGMGICIAVGSVAATCIASIWGNREIFIFDAATFMLSFLFLSLIQGGDAVAKQSEKEESVLSGYLIDLTQGFIYVKSDAQAKLLLLFNMLRSVGSGIIYFLLGVFGYKVFNAGTEGVGLFHVTFGVGFFFGSVIVKELADRLDWRHYAAVMGLAAAVEGLFIAIFSQMSNFVAALFILSISYMGRAAALTLFSSLSSRLVEERFRGRYFALLRVFSYTVMGLTMLLCGYALSVFSARQLALFAGVFLVANSVLWMFSSQKMDKMANAFINIHK
jgi:predicted MFS family arabinose efflux permease